MVAPPLALALVRNQKMPVRMKGLLYLSYAVLLAGLSLNAFARLKKTPYTMSIQPLGTLIFLIFTAIWIFHTPFWPDRKSPVPERA
jgi:hypothetical protein